MLDLTVILFGLIVLAALLLAAWRRIGGRPRSRVLSLVRGLACLIVAFLLTGLASWRLSNARTFQVFGEIVPRVDSRAPVVALTFDDGPTPEGAERILDLLDAHGIRATFFLNGQAIEQHFSAAQQIVQAGHEVGNHSYTHPKMMGLSLHQIRAEIEQTDRQIRRAGYNGAIHFRSPYGKKFVALPYYLARTNRKNIFWDVEPESFPEVARSAERITRHVVENVRPGSIILLHVMHGGRAESMNAVPQIIEALHQQGYRFLTVSELLQHP